MPHTNRKKKSKVSIDRDPRLVSEDYTVPQLVDTRRWTRDQNKGVLIPSDEQDHPTRISADKHNFLVKEGADPKILKMGVKYPFLEHLYSFKSKPKKEKAEGEKHLVRTETSPDASEVSPRFIGRFISMNRQHPDLLFTVKLTYEDILTADASGNLATVWSSDPSSGSNWVNYAATFDSFRCLGMRVSFEPNHVVGGSTSTVFGPISIVTDYDSSTALVSHATAARFANYQEVPGNRKWKHTAAMFGVEAARFVDSSAPQSFFWIKIYSTGNTNNLTIGRFHIDYVVQFRGTGA